MALRAGVRQGSLPTGSASLNPKDPKDQCLKYLSDLGLELPSTLSVAIWRLIKFQSDPLCTETVPTSATNDRTDRSHRRGINIIHIRKVKAAFPLPKEGKLHDLSPGDWVVIKDFRRKVPDPGNDTHPPDPDQAESNKLLSAVV
ncbi:hypothetical protein LDENG_00265030 [Lucifuga dentata]|nr:hypothetical protein LDENG_00265030 [Lucifuga dentata]